MSLGDEEGMQEGIAVDGVFEGTADGVKLGDEDGSFEGTAELGL